MKKIDIIYIRTSTDQQNPENQLDDVKKIAPENSIVIREEQSAWKDDIKLRPKFKEIINLIRDDKVNSLSVWDLDRVFRKRIKTVEFMNLCFGKEVLFKSYRQPFLNDFDKILDNIPKDNSIYWMIEDMVKDMKDRMIKIFGWIAEEESNKKSDRVKNAVRKKNNKTISYKGNKWGRPETEIDYTTKLRIQKDLQELSIRKVAEKYNLKKNQVEKIKKELSEN